MTRRDKGRFAAKHPPGTIVAPAILEMVRKGMDGDAMHCRKAHEIAQALGVAPLEVGTAIDKLEGDIQKCQLGLFGHGKKGYKAVRPAESVAPQLQAAIESALTDGRLACVDAWRIADTAGIARLAVASACEALKIRICRCQLGAF